jgi:hypothetical protein
MSLNLQAQWLQDPEGQILDEKKRPTLSAIVNQANKERPDDWFDPNLSALSRFLAVGVSSIRRRIKELIDLGFLVKEAKSPLVKLTKKTLRLAFPDYNPKKAAKVAAPKGTSPKVAAPKVSATKGTAPKVTFISPSGDKLGPPESSNDQTQAEKVVTTNLPLPKSLHRQLKIYAMDRDLTIVQAIKELLERGLSQS